MLNVIFYHSNLQCNEDNYEILIRILLPFLNRSINIIMDGYYNEFISHLVNTKILYYVSIWGKNVDVDYWDLNILSHI